MKRLHELGSICHLGYSVGAQHLGSQINILSLNQGTGALLHICIPDGC